MKYKKFIGKTLTVQGMNEPRTVIIKDVYFLRSNKKYPVFWCIVQGNYKHFKDGDRENILCINALSKDRKSLRPVVHVLTA